MSGFSIPFPFFATAWCHCHWPLCLLFHQVHASRLLSKMILLWTHHVISTCKPCIRVRVNIVYSLKGSWRWCLGNVNRDLTVRENKHLPHLGCRIFYWKLLGPLLCEEGNMVGERRSLLYGIKVICRDLGCCIWTVFKVNIMLVHSIFILPVQELLWPVSVCKGNNGWVSQHMCHWQGTWGFQAPGK